MELEDEGQEIALERIPCQFCDRKFVPDSLSKHSKVCEKTLHKKRKTFDSAKQRIQGTELAEFLPVMVKKSEPVAKEKPVKLETPHVPRKNKNTSPLIKSSNYDRCPYCDRSFGPRAFDRHIEWCKEQSIRINLKSSATQEAKERLEARTKYRAPSFKSKRSITREKYSPKVSHDRSEDRKEREIRPFEIDSKHKNIEKSKPKEKETNFIRQNVLRCSYRGKQTRKPEDKMDRKDNLNSNLQKKKPDYSAVEDWISANGTKILPSQPSKVTGSANKINTYENYNPYILAEHQMKELLNDVNSNAERPLNQTFTIAKRDSPSLPVRDDRRNNFHNKENISHEYDGPVKNISCQTDVADKSDKHFKTSPTSAFSKYTNGSTETVNRAPTPIPNEYNFLPPITSKSEMHNHDTNMNRYPLISLSNLSLCSSVSIDIPEDRGKCKSADKPREEIQLTPRSTSASVADKKNSVKKNLKMENLLYGSKRDPPLDEVFSTTYDEKLEKLNSLLDGENFDLLNSFTEFENVLQNSCYDNTYSSGEVDKRNPKLERGDSMGSKMSTDSAYNSLNRKSPALFESQKFYGKTSTPETDALKCSTFSLSSDFQENPLMEQKLSKFCHECGARYPLDIAKFCCECGVRRLVL